MPDNADPKPRSIDERLDGLTQTVEIIAAMQRDNEKRIAESDQRWAERSAQWDQRFDKVMNRLERLAHDA